MCDDHHEASRGAGTIGGDWRRAWETSRVEPVPLEPVSSLTIITIITITYLVDNVVDGLLPDHGTAHRPARVRRTQPCRLLLGERALDPLTAEQGFSALVTIERDGRTHQLQQTSRPLDA
ncbi:MAG TPA: hypothetical protein VF391_00495 [Dermatophilaceae bacterium]